jgi:hypothetical protein
MTGRKNWSSGEQRSVQDREAVSASTDDQRGGCAHPRDISPDIDRVRAKQERHKHDDCRTRRDFAEAMAETVPGNTSEARWRVGPRPSADRRTLLSATGSARAVHPPENWLAMPLGSSSAAPVTRLGPSCFSLSEIRIGCLSRGCDRPSRLLRDIFVTARTTANPIGFRHRGDTLMAWMADGSLVGRSLGTTSELSGFMPTKANSV